MLANPLKTKAMFVKNEDASCYALPIHVKGALALGQFKIARSFHIHDRKGRIWLSTSRRINILSKSRITKIQRSKGSVKVCERIARAAIVLVREHLFRELVTRNSTGRVFIFNEQITKTKLK